MQIWRRELEGSLANISQATKWVDQLVSDQKVPSEKAYALQVCLEEILTNIVRHGGAESVQIRLALAFFPKFVELTIEDDGIPFDVSRSIPHRVDQPLENAKVGGLGIQLIHSFADKLDYTRVGETNRVVLKFVFPDLMTTELERVGYDEDRKNVDN